MIGAFSIIVLPLRSVANFTPLFDRRDDDGRDRRDMEPLYRRMNEDRFQTRTGTFKVKGRGIGILWSTSASGNKEKH